MFSGLTDWWRRRNAAKFDYTASEEYSGSWHCNNCGDRPLVPGSQLEAHARSAHDMNTSRLHLKVNRARRTA